MMVCKRLLAITSAAVLLGLAGCRKAPEPEPVIGAWLVKDGGAPFPWHMYVFNADGTMQQANPDAGDPRTSDSDGKGIWRARNGAIEGKWVEISADRTTHKFTGRTELSFRFKIVGDRFGGSESASVFDRDGIRVAGPTPPGKFEGERVTLP